MVLALPTAVQSLGHNLDAPVPPSLGGPPQPFLDSLTREYDPCPPGGTACAANDWWMQMGCRWGQPCTSCINDSGVRRPTAPFACAGLSRSSAAPRV
jgi:hypothetical protein